MVPDIYQIFVKGSGVFCNLGSNKHPAKLRLLYEIGPLSYLVHKAGGATSNGEKDMMELEVESYN
jgi:sedoheptulose-bisphosphatase